MMILATGGTAKACGGGGSGEIVQLNFLMEISFLNGREKLRNMSFFGDHLLA
jgi:adenine phosphoribosyltransferase